MSVQDKIERLRALHNAGAVVGLGDVSGVLPRKDIDVMMRDDEDTFNLFVLAFEQLVKPERHNEWMSYYQIAGIHGLPLKAWDGIEGDIRWWDSDKKQFLLYSKGKVNKYLGPLETESGYCAHALETFPTWHRPYLVMLEQSLFIEMIALIEGANLTPELNKKWIDAALRFRMPYWDYFRPRARRTTTFSGIVDGEKTVFPYDYRAPLAFITEQIKLKDLASDKYGEPRDNPLFAFKFPRGQLDGDIDAAQMKLSKTITQRRPGEAADAFANLLNKRRMDTNRIALNMMLDDAYAPYDLFSTKRFGGLPKTDSRIVDRQLERKAAGSLEGLHDSYHGACGGLGHMGRVHVAAFDPIFWFHHNQIERLFTTWQAIHAKDEKNWFSSVPEMANENLLPFRKTARGADETFWTSTSCKSSESFGYTYEDVFAGDKAAIQQKFARLYEWSVPLTSAGKVGKPPKEMEPIPVQDLPFFEGLVAPEEDEPESQPESSELQQHLDSLTDKRDEITAPPKDEEFTYEWYIDDRVEKTATEDAFSILYFINQTPGPLETPDGIQLLNEPTLAGTTYVFSSATAICPNCASQKEAAVLVSNTNAITALLLDYKEKRTLPSLRPDDVVPFLKDRLRWRILNAKGEGLPTRYMSEQKGFRLNISVKKAELPRGSGIVTYESYPQILETIVDNASEVATNSTLTIAAT